MLQDLKDIKGEASLLRRTRVPIREIAMHPSPSDVPPPETSIDPNVVYRTTAETELAYETLLARRKEREEFVAANFGHPLADEYGCVHPSASSSATPVKLEPIKLSSIVPSTPATPHPYTPDPSRNKDVEYLLQLGCIFDCRPPMTTPTEDSDVQFLESLEASLAEYAAEHARGNMIPPAYNPVIDLKGNKFYGRIEDCAKIAIQEYNKIEDTEYKYTRIVKAGSQQVSGTNYFIIFQAKDSDHLDTFEAFAHSLITSPLPNLVYRNTVQYVCKSGCKVHKIPCDV